MVKRRVFRSKITHLSVVALLIYTLAGCSNEYTPIGPRIEGSRSITGGAMFLMAGEPGGVGSADGVGSFARFNSPRSIVAYGDTLYVADQDNHVIRKIDLSTGLVKTIAGYSGYRGVGDGIGVSARFNTPEGITTDGVFLYVADTQNHAIRKIDMQSLQVFTLAGMRGQAGNADGLGTSAQFNAPTGITLLGDFLYVADTDNNVIRRVDKNSGNTITVASSFYYPMDVVTDGRYLYIADTYNHYIKLFDPETGNVSILSGMSGGGYADGLLAEARFLYPYGLTIQGSELFVAELLNDDIRVIDLTYGVVSTLSGTPEVRGNSDGPPGEGKFNSPADITIAGDYLYVADMGNHAIRAVNISTGELSTIAGYPPHAGVEDETGGELFNVPGGVILDGDTLYVADTYNHSIRKIDIGTGKTTTIAGTPGVSGATDSTESPALFNLPTDVIINEAGDFIYIVDTYNHVVRSMNILTGEVRTFVGYPLASGAQDGIGTNARFNSPKRGVRIGEKLYVVDTGNHTIRCIDVNTKEVTTLAGKAGIVGATDQAEGADEIARFNSPGDITTDGTFLYVTDTGNHTIRKVNPLTGMVKTIAGTSGTPGLLDSIYGGPLFNLPEGIVWNSGILYIADTGNHVLRKLDISTGEVFYLAGDMDCVDESETVDGVVIVKKRCMGQPAGLSLYGDSTDGTGKTTSFNDPTGLSTDGIYLYVMDSGINLIRRVNMETGETKSFSFTGNKGVSLNMSKCTTDSEGNKSCSPMSGGDLSGNFLYVADSGNHIIRRLDITNLAGAPLITIAGNVGTAGYRYSAAYSAKLNRPVGITIDDSGNLYVTDTGNHTIRKIVAATGEVTTVSGVPGIAGFMNSDFGYPLFNLPRGLCVVGNNLYVADSGNHLIRRVNLTTGYVGLVAGLSDYVKNIGSPGTSDSTGAAAGFTDPRGITSDGTYLYVTDSGNHTIRRILRTTGQVKTIAGMPGEAGYKDGLGFDARFNYPRGIVVDGDYLYVADTGNNVFRRVNKITGEVLTFSGKKGESSSISGTRDEARYNNVVSVTASPDTPYIYFTDSAENVVGRIEK